MIKCSICSEHKNKDCYEPGRRQCKDCRNKRRKEYGTRSGIGLRDYRLNYLYKINLDDYNRMLKEQKGVCKICEKIETQRWGKLAVDHCHATGKVRGLLCDKCNKALGQFNEDIDRMIKAIKYLKGEL